MVGEAVRDRQPWAWHMTGGDITPRLLVPSHRPLGPPAVTSPKLPAAPGLPV